MQLTFELSRKTHIKVNNYRKIRKYLSVRSSLDIILALINLLLLEYKIHNWFLSYAFACWTPIDKFRHPPRVAYCCYSAKHLVNLISHTYWVSPIWYHKYPCSNELIKTKYFSDTKWVNDQFLVRLHNIQNNVLELSIR